jgi:hypothetical protein
MSCSPASNWRFKKKIQPMNFLGDVNLFSGRVKNGAMVIGGTGQFMAQLVGNTFAFLNRSKRVFQMTEAVLQGNLTIRSIHLTIA